MTQFDRGPSDRDEKLESQLRDALRAVAPSEAFTEALLARLASERSRELGREPRSEQAPARAGSPNDARAASGAGRVTGRTGRYSGWWLSASLAASVLVAVGAAQHLKAEHERERGLEAKREVIEALRVTNQKLDLAYQAVRTQGDSLSEGDPGV
jgi:hypothetical protein